MNHSRTQIRQSIVAREAERRLTRWQRLWRQPWRTGPYYMLAALSRIRPFKQDCCTVFGTRLTCYLPEGNTFYYYGYCEANLTNFFLRLLKAGDHFFDVGAHVGFYSQLAAELVGPSGQVTSFEPTPWLYQLLVRNTTAWTNIRTVNQAVGAQIGSLPFTDHGPGFGAYNSAQPHWADQVLGRHRHQTIAVPATTLDHYGQETGQRPEVIKIDTEGLETAVLQGASSLWQSTGAIASRPIITLELAGGQAWTGQQTSAKRLLEQAGYQPYQITIDGQLSDQPIKVGIEYDNIAFLPQERLSSLKSLLLP